MVYPQTPTFRFIVQNGSVSSFLQIQSQQKKPVYCSKFLSLAWPTLACFGLVMELSDYSLNWNRMEVDLPPTSQSSVLLSMTAMQCLGVHVVCVCALYAVWSRLRRGRKCDTVAQES
ncbi:hypothetical protein AMECASPLE_007031 [Ameca splendens]|uniref:Uncharacterized protein n=1 Tax=Ameca splendens TaxID=208324 RepID=A0ABV0YY66_9TELE